MALELLQSTAQTVRLTPDIRGAAATAVLYDESNNTIESLTATLDSVDTTVASVGSTPDVLTLTSVTGIVAGRDYWYTSADGWSCIVRVSQIDGSVVTLETPPVGAPTAADTFKGLGFSVSIAAASLATRGKYRLDWRVDSTTPYRQLLLVVAMKARDPVTAADAKRLAYDHFKSWAKEEPVARWVRVAYDATQLVREELTALEDYPHLIFDQDRLKRAGETGIRLVLAGLGRIPPGRERAEYEAEQRTWLAEQCRKAVAGNVVDRNDDKVMDSDETRGLSNIRIEFT